MEFTFNSLKTTQAAGVLLSLEKRVMDRMRLLKLLYIADRELLAARGRTLTGDRAVAMNQGPVLSQTYNLTEGNEDSPEYWDKHIRSVGDQLVLMGDPGRGELSRREVDKLNELTERFRNITTEGLSALTHEYSEWLKNFVPDRSMPIPWVDVLKDMCDEDRIEVYTTRLEEQHLIDSILTIPVEEEVEARSGS
jgi:uncharacterized phage-associated protein